MSKKVWLAVGLTFVAIVVLRFVGFDLPGMIVSAVSPAGAPTNGNGA